jgi:hypothetical protein
MNTRVGNKRYARGITGLSLCSSGYIAWARSSRGINGLYNHRH